MPDTVSSRARPVGPLPLVVGVTGHRDLRLQDCDTLETRVDEIFLLLQEQYPHTPLVLLSALAEGADRLVARVAISRGVKLVAPLPMPEALYEEDFPDAASRDEFRTLVASASSCFSLMRPDEQEAVRHGDASRDAYYQRAGAYIARHAQIIIALWDGTFSGLTGGTSEIVRFQLEGVPPPYAPARTILDSVDSGPVFHIVTPRVRNAHPHGEPLSVRTYIPETGLENVGSVRSPLVTDQRSPGRRYDEIFRQLDGFNRDAARLESRLSMQRGQSMEQILPPVETGTLDGRFQRAVEAFGFADTLAVHFRARTVYTMSWLFVVAFSAAVLVDIYGHFKEHLNHGLALAVLAFYLIALIVAPVYWYLVVRRHDVQNKYQDYRALAEGVRVQCFWYLAGLHDDSVADHYLRRQRSELDWIRNGIRVLDIPMDGRGRSEDLHEEGERLHLVKDRWIDGQRDFYLSRTARDRSKRKRTRYAVPGFFSLGVVVALVMVGLAVFARSVLDHHQPIEAALLVTSTLSLVAAGLLEGHAEKMAYSEQAKQYQRMAELFARASVALGSLIHQRKFQESAELIRELGTEALAEHADWLILHRGRPVEIVAGG